jgi:hypothetical protein
MELKIDFANEIGTDVSSRDIAGELRVRICRHVMLNETPVELDMSGVRTIANCFADELFAILLLRNGGEWFRENVKLKGLSQRHRDDITFAVSERFSHQRNQCITAVGESCVA